MYGLVDDVALSLRDAFLRRCRIFHVLETILEMRIQFLGTIDRRWFRRFGRDSDPDAWFLGFGRVQVWETEYEKRSYAKMMVLATDTQLINSPGAS